MKKVLVLMMLLPCLAFAAYPIQNEAGGKMNISADMLNVFSYAKSATGVTSQGMSTTRGRLMLSGTANDRLSYVVRFKFDGATVGGTNNSIYSMIDYAYFTYKFADELKVSFGKQAYLIGAWRHYSLSGMSPQSFIIGGSKFGTPYSPALTVAGKVADLVNYEVQVANDAESYAATNLDKRYNVLAHVWTTNGLDINLYKMADGLKYLTGVSAANYAASTARDKPIVSPYAIVTYNNLFVTTSADIELTKNAKTYEYQIGTGYLFAEQFRPSLTYRAYKLQGSTVKPEHTLAAQFMLFTYGGIFKPFVEYGLTAKKGSGTGTELRVGAALNI